MAVTVGSGTVTLGSTYTNGSVRYTLTQAVNGLDLTIDAANNYVWAGGSKGNWNYVTNNWTLNGTNTLFQSSNNAIFNNAAAVALTNSGITAQEVTVANNTGTVGFTGGILNASSLTMNGAGTLSVSNTLSLSSGLTATAGTVNLNASNNVIPGGITLSGSSKLVPLYGGSLGAGTLTMNGATLAPGAKATNIANAIALGDGGNSVTNAAGLVLSGPISGSGNLYKSGAGTLTLSGTNASYTGSFYVNAGTLSGTAASLNGNITLAGKTLSLIHI